MSVVVPLAVMVLAVALARLESGLLGRPGVAPARPGTPAPVRTDTPAPGAREQARVPPAPPGRDLVGAAR